MVRKGLRSAGAPVVVALAVVLIFLALLVAEYDFNPSALIGLGSANPLNDPASLPDNLIVFDSDGYDGQHFYHTALSLVRGERPAVPAVRVQRIGYPLAVAMLSLGQERVLPYAMIAANLLAIAAGTALFARLLRRRNLSPWWSLLFALHPGMILEIQMDLALPMAMAFTAGAWLCWEERRLWAASALLAMALLTRESAVLFVIPLVAAELLAKRGRGAAILSLSVVPFLAWQIVLRLWLGAGGMAASAGQFGIPGAGMAEALRNAAGRLGQGVAAMARQGSVVAVMALVVAALVVSLWKMRRGYDAYTGSVFIHAAFALFAAIDIWVAYASAGRVFAGIFPLFVLSYAVRRDRPTLALLAATALLALFTLLRPFVITPYVPFIVTG